MKVFAQLVARKGQDGDFESLNDKVEIDISSIFESIKWNLLKVLTSGGVVIRNGAIEIQEGERHLEPLERVRLPEGYIIGSDKHGGVSITFVEPTVVITSPWFCAQPGDVIHPESTILIPAGMVPGQDDKNEDHFFTFTLDLS